MYSFSRDKNIIINKYSIDNHDYVCFCFGEIDCRAHINKFKEWKVTIDNLVKEYFVAISENVKNLNVKVCVYNAVPQLQRELEEFNWIKKWEMEDPVTRSTRGTDEQRKQYTIYMNKKLKEYCEKYNFIFFDIYERYVDELGYLNKLYHDNNCHIKDPIFIREKILEIIKM